MKYLVVMPEVAYVTRNDGKGVIDAWDAPKGKWFKPQAAVEIPEDFNSSQAFRDVVILDKIEKST